MHPQDLLIWQDSFRCFREELSPALGRDYNYRVVEYNSDEWVKVLSTPMMRSAIPMPNTDTKR